MKQIFIHSPVIEFAAQNYAAKHKYNLFRIAFSVPISEFVYEVELQRCLKEAARLNCVEYCFVSMTQYHIAMKNTAYCRIDILGFAKQ